MSWNKLDGFKLQEPIRSGFFVGVGLILGYDLRRVNFVGLLENAGNEQSIGLLK